MYSKWQDTLDLYFYIICEEYFRGLAWTVNQRRKVMDIFSSLLQQQSMLKIHCGLYRMCLINVLSVKDYVTFPWICTCNIYSYGQP
jgi:hypothetical protein